MLGWLRRAVCVFLITAIQDHLQNASICLCLRWEVEKSSKRHGPASLTAVRGIHTVINHPLWTRKRLALSNLLHFPFFRENLHSQFMPVTLRWHSSLMRWCSSPGHCSNLLCSHAMLTLITGILSCNIPRYSIFSVKHARVDESSVSQSGKSISHKPQFLLMLLYGSWRFYPRGTNHVFCTVSGGGKDVSFTSFRGRECMQS